MTLERLALSPRPFAGFVFLASAVVLGSALVSQYWGGLVPCELCVLQRWPWAVAIVVSLVALLVGQRPALPAVALVVAIIFAASVAFAFYHVGVEQKWFAGPSACTASVSGAMSLEQMRQKLLATDPVMCDQVQWSLFGVSLAGWNLLASLVMLAVSIAVFVAARRSAARRRLA